MISHITSDFRAAFARLPEHVRRQARAAYHLFCQDPHHPSLQFKSIVPSIYSVRIGPHYRALGKRREDTIIWYWIGSHADYDRLWKRQ